jgi:hypothetical protein
MDSDSAATAPTPNTLQLYRVLYWINFFAIKAPQKIYTVYPRQNLITAQIRQTRIEFPTTAFPALKRLFF